jgi:hypothetical protein
MTLEDMGSKIGPKGDKILFSFRLFFVVEKSFIFAIFLHTGSDQFRMNSDKLEISKARLPL